MSLALYQLLGSVSLLYFLNLITACCFRLFILPNLSVSVICVDVTSLSGAGKASHLLRSYFTTYVAANSARHMELRCLWPVLVSINEAHSGIIVLKLAK